MQRYTEWRNYLEQNCEKRISKMLNSVVGHLLHLYSIVLGPSHLTIDQKQKNSKNVSIMRKNRCRYVFDRKILG